MRLPLFFKELIGFNILPLGALYYVYMILMLVFCSQSINIHAGINGLEPGQSFIIGLVCLVWNIIEFSIDSHKEKRDDCLLSIFIIIPLLATSLALLTFNWFPAQVFVGDTYTLFAGMTLGVASVLGHFSKLTFMFFIPQLLNFLLSLPQLMGLFGMTCPRHRLCRFNLDERILEGRPEFLNLLNQSLVLCGSMSEENACVLQLVFQYLCSLIGLGIGVMIRPGPGPPRVI